MSRLAVRLVDSHLYAVPTFLQGLLRHALPWLLGFALIALIFHYLYRDTENRNFHWRQDGLRYQASGESSSVCRYASRIERTWAPYTKSYRYLARCAERATQPYWPSKLGATVSVSGSSYGHRHTLKRHRCKHKPVKADSQRWHLHLAS